MKKTVFIILLLYLLLPSAKVFAYNDGNGFFDNNPVTVNPSGAASIYDNDTETRYYLNGKGEVVVDLKRSVDLKKAEIYFSGEPMQVAFLDVNNKIVYQFKTPAIGYMTSREYLVIMKNVRYISMRQISPSPYNTNLFQLEVYENKSIEHQSVMNLKSQPGIRSMDLFWTNPINDNITSIVIKKNGLVIGEVGRDRQSYTVTGLEPETEYQFDVMAKYVDGVLSESKTITAITLPPPKPADDVAYFNAHAKYDRVDLSWTLPESENFKHVNIYRQTAEKTALLDRILLINTASAAAGKKIFETNGTYFNDLTVEPETTYQYTVTTTSTDLVESAGVSKTVTTPKKPDPEIVGGEFEKDPATGSYIYRWTQPDTGQVKVIVGGKLYKTVSASDKVIVIPAKDMKFKGLDEPDVRLIPVDEDGKEGAAVTPPAVGGGTGGMLDKVDLPFTAGDLLGTGTGLFWLIGPFVLLALAFLLVPKLRNMIVRAFTGPQPDGTEGRFRSREGEREERIRQAREREIAGRRDPTERPERSIRESRERVHQARVTRQERRSTP